MIITIYFVDTILDTRRVISLCCRRDTMCAHRWAPSAGNAESATLSLSLVSPIPLFIDHHTHPARRRHKWQIVPNTIEPLTTGGRTFNSQESIRRQRSESATQKGGENFTIREQINRSIILAYNSLGMEGKEKFLPPRRSCSISSIPNSLRG